MIPWLNSPVCLRACTLPLFRPLEVIRFAVAAHQRLLRPSPMPLLEFWAVARETHHNRAYKLQVLLPRAMLDYTLRRRRGGGGLERGWALISIEEVSRIPDEGLAVGAAGSLLSDTRLSRARSLSLVPSQYLRRQKEPPPPQQQAQEAFADPQNGERPSAPRSPAPNKKTRLKKTQALAG
ncbi:hypothetical protein NDU88_000892 [Pleurodeles waltl]|uniref:Uncharacterized protein n=1 Tax=Pleurodeles waltl TaxID=8319 RepID=A0AAV7S9C8_PLEWA|nr:hypothetical protein NDU88_000892 [Pleurodeles waltl]